MARQAGGRGRCLEPGGAEIGAAETGSPPSQKAKAKKPRLMVDVAASVVLLGTPAALVVVPPCAPTLHSVESAPLAEHDSPLAFGLWASRIVWCKTLEAFSNWDWELWFTGIGIGI